MKAMIGIIKEIDKLGRIVIPKDFRDRFGLTESVEIIGTEADLLLRSPQHTLVKTDKDKICEDE